jgi:hypothetical protein
MPLPLIHRLIYTWAGWPKDKNTPLPAEPDESFFTNLGEAWASDGLEMISRKWTPERIQITFRADPVAAPVFVTARAKGRLDHALRKSGHPTAFSRRVGFRTLGENTSPVVLRYLARQYDRADLADPKYINQLRAASWVNPDFNSADPQPTGHGRYWFDLHMVLVTEGRFRIGRWINPLDLRDATLEWGENLARTVNHTLSGHAQPGVKSLAVMHDHVHVAFRGHISHSPHDMAGDLLTRLNRRAGCRVMQERIYVGSFSEYSVHAISDLRPTPARGVEAKRRRSRPTRP